MSPQNPSLIVGLAAPGLLWLATSVAPGQSVPPPQAPAQAPTYAALLLSNGKVVRGEIVEDAGVGVYRLRQGGGSVPFPRSMVQKAAGSVEELYRFRVARLAVSDPDERVKLARWCLTEHLPAQAREQLLAVQAMCPNDAEVDRMLKNLSANVSGVGKVDEATRQAGFEAPSPLSPQAVVKARNHYGNALPVIFDLPPAQAVPRAAEFARYIQPILLQNCARCHNDKYPGMFQLVEVRNNRDKQNPDIARANLDATLRLIDPDDPSQSKLLSSGLVPHGPSKNAIFSGPNNPSYRDLANWTKSLRPAPNAAARPAGGPVNRTGFNAPEPAPMPGDGFAADRGGRGPSGRAPAPSPLPGLDVLSAGKAAMPPPPSRRIVNNYDESADFSGNPDAEFQLPFVAGGAPPVQPPPARQPTNGAKAPVNAPVPQANVTQVAPGTVVVGSTDDPNLLPGMNQPLYPTSVGADSPAKKNKPKIDNALLEKMMKNRNSNP
jgi:hypothetical protein